MFHVIERIVPAPIHRLLMPAAHRIRHWWRKLAKAPLAGCMIILENPQGCTLLLRHSYGPDAWSLPGGGVGRKEDAHHAALRELSEELQLSLGELQLVGIIEDQVSGSPHRAHVFTAVTDQPPTPDQREVLEARFFPSDALPEKISKRSQVCLTLLAERRADASEGRSQQR